MKKIIFVMCAVFALVLCNVSSVAATDVEYDENILQILKDDLYYIPINIYETTDGDDGRVEQKIPTDDYEALMNPELYSEDLKATGFVLDDQVIIRTYLSMPWRKVELSYEFFKLELESRGHSYIILDEEPIRVSIKRDQEKIVEVDLLSYSVGTPSTDYTAVYSLLSMPSTIDVLGQTCKVKDVMLMDIDRYYLYGQVWITYVNTDKGAFVKCYSPKLEREEIFTYDEFVDYSLSFYDYISPSNTGDFDMLSYIDSVKDNYEKFQRVPSLERIDETTSSETTSSADTSIFNDSEKSESEDDSILVTVIIICSCTVLTVGICCLLTVRAVKKKDQ